MPLDTMGQRVDEIYTIMTDPTFERRLKAFDPRLKLMFDQASKRWVILEWAYDNSGWNIILKCEDSEGKPKPLGDWVFNKLYAYRQNWITMAEGGVDNWLNSLSSQADEYKRKKDEEASSKHIDMILDEINEWRRAARELDGLPKSDVTAGYPKH